MFAAYLKVNARCPACGEELSHQRADDAPSWLTLLIVCVAVGAGVSSRMTFGRKCRFFSPLSCGLP